MARLLGHIPQPIRPATRQGSVETVTKGKLIKVRTTIDYTDAQRIVIGAIKAGDLKPATREQIDEYVCEVMSAALAVGVRKLEQVQAQLVQDIGSADS